jgi:hypothetical protein
VLREWLVRVRRGSLGRREFTRGLVALGLTPPLINEMLRSHGIAQAQTKRGTFTPTGAAAEAAQDALVAGADLLNPHWRSA